MCSCPIQTSVPRLEFIFEKYNHILKKITQELALGNKCVIENFWFLQIGHW